MKRYTVGRPTMSRSTLWLCAAARTLCDALFDKASAESVRIEHLCAQTRYRLLLLRFLARQSSTMSTMSCSRMLSIVVFSRSPRSFLLLVSSNNSPI